MNDDATDEYFSEEEGDDHEDECSERKIKNNNI
eukprot:CAMPEP_0116891232 /NCGR_PEP_ID=MMETSP0467-20121206/1690_1 /TAXON_ID=283647 /ORGANISM="Mesodinium pulex, Strain SPMC105" /LENGTH=32 /DNA_ID= /DNA_START= /DNA_END= /DNA_ORIENTATION=